MKTHIWVLKIRICILKTEFVFYRIIHMMIISKQSKCQNQNPHLGFKIRIWILKTEFVFYRIVNMNIILKQTKCQNQNPHLGFEIRICILKTEFVFYPHPQHDDYFETNEMSKSKPVFGF